MRILELGGGGGRRRKSERLGRVRVRGQAGREGVFLRGGEGRDRIWGWRGDAGKLCQKKKGRKGAFISPLLPSCALSCFPLLESLDVGEVFPALGWRVGSNIFLFFSFRDLTNKSRFVGNWMGGWNLVGGKMLES